MFPDHIQEILEPHLNTRYVKVKISSVFLIAGSIITSISSSFCHWIHFYLHLIIFMLDHFFGYLNRSIEQPTDHSEISMAEFRSALIWISALSKGLKSMAL